MINTRSKCLPGAKTGVLPLSVWRPLLVKAAPQVTRTADSAIFANPENRLLFIYRPPISERTTVSDCRPMPFATAVTHRQRAAELWERCIRAALPRLMG